MSTNRRDFLKKATTGFAGIAVGSSAMGMKAGSSSHNSFENRLESGRRKGKRPNVIYILTDQWRASSFGYAGDPNVKTPNIDNFARKSVNFSNAVSACPVCTPHRASLLTGRYPCSTGMFLNDIYLPKEEVCMGDIFKSAGYNTAYIGKWHLDGHGRLNNVEPDRRQGFDYWKGLECSHDYNHMAYYENEDPDIKYWKGYSPDAVAEDANNYLDDHAKNDDPFLLFVSIAAPHFPLKTAPQRYKDMYPTDKIILAPNVSDQYKDQARVELQGYYGHCTAVDAAIGSIFDKIKELDLQEDSIIVFSSDHGEMMGAHNVHPWAKQLAWDESINVPFLIRYPSIGENEGRLVEAPINTPDILPSLLGLTGIKIPDTIDGEDISGLIKNPNPYDDRVALVMNLCPFDTEYKYPEYRAIRTKQYTYARTPSGADKLFDDWKDPYQMNNMVNDPKYADLQKNLDAKLDQALAKAGDDFKPRGYYLSKWHFDINNKVHAINYWDFNKGKGVVQSPTLNK